MALREGPNSSKTLTLSIAGQERSKKSHRASAKVFATDEVLERILLELPCLQLFLLQRTCIQFRNVIKDSSRLQQAMFLQAKPLSSDSALESKAIINPLLSQIVLTPTEIFDQVDGLYFSQSSLAQTDIQNKTLNLFICSETNAWKPWLPRLSTTSPNASWKHMLISQPPPSNFFNKLHAQPRFSEEKKKKVEVSFTATHGRYLGKGFTLGEVFEELDQSYGSFVNKCKRKKQVNRRDLRMGRKGAGKNWNWTAEHVHVFPGRWSLRGTAVLDGSELAPFAREMLRREAFEGDDSEFSKRANLPAKQARAHSKITHSHNANHGASDSGMRCEERRREVCAMCVPSTRPRTKQDRENTSQKACDKVVHTTELLEMVLLSLDCITLYGVQRVCRAFRTTSQGSKKIREAMFLEAESEQEAANNREMFLEEGDEKQEVKNIRDFIQINPLLERGVFTPTSALHVGTQVDGISFGYLYRNKDARPGLFMYLESEKPEWDMSLGRVSDSPEASWRRMLISRPPRPNFRAELTMDQKYWAYHDLPLNVRQKDPEWHPGRTLGAVFAVLEKYYEEVRPVLEEISSLREKMR
ncbi:hypothetical protein HII31_11975 [Pseudocercospora fuligena]|uniref:F-box domain-containing protein n=1 Tax=Pseudocercospora fuligena TaxID=685502 RepID=A0A8H6R924_9PEZI|nr:hypothetical protein HII31_11975 [Pseudocercospora fuligena]